MMTAITYQPFVGRNHAKNDTSSSRGPRPILHNTTPEVIQKDLFVTSGGHLKTRMDLQTHYVVEYRRCNLCEEQFPCNGCNSIWRLAARAWKILIEGETCGKVKRLWATDHVEGRLGGHIGCLPRLLVRGGRGRDMWGRKRRENILPVGPMCRCHYYYYVLGALPVW